MSDLIEIADSLEKQEVGAYGAETTDEVNSSNSSRGRSTAYLDGLRGLAAMMVYMSHHVPWFYGFDEGGNNTLDYGFGDGSKELAKLPFIRVLFTGGSAAVAIFFVLSGYVLSRGPLSVLIQGNRDKCYSRLVSATIRRPLRLFIPAAGVSLGLALIMQLPFGLAPHLTWPEAKANLFAELLNWISEFRRVIDPFDAHSIGKAWFPYDPPLWTIAIEFRGSLIVFALIAVYSRVGSLTRLALFTGTGLAFLLWEEWSLFCFMAGIALALNDLEGFDNAIFKRCSLRTRNFWNMAFFMLGWWLIGQPGGKEEPERGMAAPGWYYLTMMVPDVYWQHEYWRFWHATGSVFLVYGLLRIRILQELFNSKYLRYLGKVSFSLYLTHIPFLWTVGDRIYRILGTSRMDFTTIFDNRLYIPDVGPRGLSTRFLMAQGFILPLNLLISEMATIWLDEPSVRIGRWLSDKVMSRTSRVPETPVQFKELRNDT